MQASVLFQPQPCTCEERVDFHFDRMLFCQPIHFTRLKHATTLAGHNDTYKALIIWAMEITSAPCYLMKKKQIHETVKRDGTPGHG